MENTLESESSFLVSVSGQIKSAKFLGIDNIYCKFTYSYGTDWAIASGNEDGISQITKKSRDKKQLFVWNIPLEVVFKSSNCFGWPQLVISVYGFDWLGNDVVRGYGCAHIPAIAGLHHRRIEMFTPQSSSLLHWFTSLFTGRSPEFVNPKLIAQSEGRDVIRVRSNGYVDITFSVVLKDFTKSGFRSN